VSSAEDTSFEALPLSRALLANLPSLGYERMTPIQAQSLPRTLEGSDLLALAKTGSGKTAAFSLPLLMRLEAAFHGTQALVLTPTRELAEQVAGEIRRLARGMENIKVLVLSGGQPIRPQLASLEHGAHVVVGTPGRVLDHLGRGSLELRQLRTLVLDEADRMLDMGFLPDITRVLERCPEDRQTMLFSATFPPDLEAVGMRMLRNPVRIRLEEPRTCEQLRQQWFRIEDAQRPEAVRRLLEHHRSERALVFCNTKEACKRLCEHLEATGHAVLALHGDLEQRERDQVLIRFENRSATVLVATDVAARGIDIPDLELVINAEVSPDADTHTHRVGRTARVDREGLALSLVSPGERHRAERIEEVRSRACEWTDWAAVPRTQAKPSTPRMATIQILGGRKQKQRPGDILGALTAEGGLRGEQVGKIEILDMASYVAVEREQARLALHMLRGGVKGRVVRAQVL
jgi:ATP-independent RNA helicase DbpA